MKKYSADSENNLESVGWDATAETTETEIREYFTPENFRFMFGPDESDYDFESYIRAAINQATENTEPGRFPRQIKTGGQKMEHVTGEQLEAGSYDRHKGEATCCKCAASINVNEDNHGVSRDGESYVCGDCIGRYPKISTSQNKDLRGYVCWSADARFYGESLGTGDYPSAQAALKRAAEMAEYCWDVESFVEVN
jgi:hypothetical protein